MSDNTQYRYGDTLRTYCGQGRATYQPWCVNASYPWLVVWQGEVVKHEATLQDAREWFRNKHNAELKDKEPISN